MTQSANIGHGTARPYIGKSRQFKRSRTGCLNCRHRKKKCSEEKPQCRGCSRNNLHCAWPQDVNEKAITPPPLPKNPIASTDERPSPGHYITTTASMLPMPLKGNPFLSEIIPIASVDDMVMHGVLVISGAHMNFGNMSSGPIGEATLDHYSTLIRQLVIEVSDHKGSCVNKLARLLLVLVMLCHFEAISGETDGAMFRHLGASREIIAEIESRQPAEPLGSDSETLYVLGLELYAYLIFVNCLTPYGLLQERQFSLDSFITSPSSLASYSTFGIMFAGLHDLFALIPQISLLFRDRLIEQESGIIEPSIACVELHTQLERCLKDWNLSQNDLVSRFPTDDCNRDLSKVTKVLQLGIKIYLIASMQGSSVVNPKIVCQLQSYVDDILDLGLDLHYSQWSSILLWPIVISGSCSIQRQQQEHLAKALRESKYLNGRKGGRRKKTNKVDPTIIAYTFTTQPNIIGRRNALSCGKYRVPRRLQISNTRGIINDSS
ncbi:fungal-specific transcription factor domain-containing protein [Fusarium oxysporum Fo47]|uniref:fungal-specific transcription factor domain-containing protein n=1 Tax=Fusarium oxysporum Fo47 TaxID=660027 RepID=UPI002869C16E|nr:fungal-specific transcription factor domain-containing protein [Fusarium oxysporum Fo47]WJG35234.1 fungal-specific transcription factor domain-domain-containing protein [Fusarium oxysporum Fo47]